jgi:hypothetical protein
MTPWPPLHLVHAHLLQTIFLKHCCYRLPAMLLAFQTLLLLLQAWLGAPVSRISPLLNAVDIDQYPISTTARPPRPTTVMLSHVYPLKDIVSAIRAAAIIVHHYHISGDNPDSARVTRRLPAAHGCATGC